jgi:hypothetical protein
MKKSYQFIFFVILIYILFYFPELDQYYTESILTRTIENDGFCVLYNPLYSKKTTSFPCKELEHDILCCLPKNYLFIDYVYKINNVSLSTFHRDVTSSQNIYNTEYPVYTVILYKYSGELLSLCPGSHASYPFVLSHILNINGEPGTVFLFNSDILHAGRINNWKYREVIQYKVCHKDDLSKLRHLIGVRMDKTDICVVSYWNLFLRKLSYYFQIPINNLFYPFMIKREQENTFIGNIQKIIPVQYYNNG